MALVSYYMEETAYFFAFAQFYNRWLIGPAVLGLGVFVYNLVILTPTRSQLGVCLRSL